MTDWRWPHFSPAELACRCCGELPEEIDAALLDRLEALRTLMQKPLRINSGHRCRARNLVVKGAAYSQHKSFAVDVSLINLDPETLLKNSIALGFLGIGLGPTFLHLDMRNEIDGYQPPKQLTVWHYPRGKEKWESILKTANESVVGV